MKWLYTALVTIGALLSPHLAQASEAASTGEVFTILHTNDWQSRLLGFGPNAEYSPDSTGDDKTVGGVARLATLLRERRALAEQHGAVLVLDGGDFLMGTLFHTISRETGLELQLLADLGFDASVLGNHEFDYWPDGLAKTIKSAQAKTPNLPKLLATNIQFSDSSPVDDQLAALMPEDLISRSVIIERGGLKFGLVGVMGIGAAEVTTTQGPITFDDPVSSTRAAIMALKAEHNPDAVIVLSHSGIVPDADGNWSGEDVAIAEGSPDIDVVVGGHSHTPIFQPIVAATGAPVLQAGSECQYLGELKMRRQPDGSWKMESYMLHPVDDRILGESAITAKLDEAKAMVNSELLAPKNYSFDQPIAKTTHLLTRHYKDVSVGNLVTNSIRHVANSDVAFTGNGTLRDEIRPGATGIQRVSDLFRVASLGLSLQDDSPGYPITKFFVTGRDLKNFTEVLLIAPTLKGGNFFPRFSGMRVHHNPQRIPLDKIYDIEIGDIRTGYESIDLSDSSDKLYSVATTTYVAGFIWVVEKLSHGLLSVIPRNADGEPLKDLQGAIFDVAPQQSGVQQVKEWEAMLEYLKSVPERTPDGLADMDAMPTIREEHVFRSTSPMTLLKNATYLMWTALVSILLVVSTGGLLISRRLRRSES